MYMHIKMFIGKMSAIEGRNNRDVVLPLAEARGLRDDIARLLTDLHDLQQQKDAVQEVIQVEIKGGSFK